MQRVSEAVERRPLDFRHIVVARLLRRSLTGSKAWVMLGTLLATLIAFPVYSQELQGVVIAQDGKPKPYVAVDVLGPRKVYTQTDAEGRFNVSVLPGSYVIRIREGQRRMEFPQQITNGVNQEQFKLKW